MFVASFFNVNFLGLIIIFLIFSLVSMRLLNCLLKTSDPKQFAILLNSQTTGKITSILCASFLHHISLLRRKFFFAQIIICWYFHAFFRAFSNAIGFKGCYNVLENAHKSEKKFLMKTSRFLWKTKGEWKVFR